MNVTKIHPLAIVDPSAELGQGVVIGPFCVVEAGVRLGARTQLAAHVVVKADTQIGEDNRVAEAAIIGGAPQHLGAKETLGGLRIGDRNIIREQATIHRGMREGEDTTIGHDNCLMINAHVAHDCRLGDRVIMANNTMLAGHVSVDQGAFLSGGVAVHQFCRIGKYAMIGGLAAVRKDVPHFVTLDGTTARIVGLNKIGLVRNGFSQDDIRQLKSAYQLVYRSGLPWSEMLQRLKRDFHEPPACELVSFFQAGTRGFVPERRKAPALTVKVVAPEPEAAPLRKAA